ncbi:M1 family peptidase [Alteromonadaceae bacterium M269]|nr:M1 family peptidase [Alteromonadaceae bacterium M269]
MNLYRLALLSSVPALLLACGKAPEQAEETVATEQVAPAEETQQIEAVDNFDFSKDYHSYGNPEDIAVKHLDLDLTVDFDTKSLTGYVDLTVERQQDSANTLVLDTRNIDINKVTVDGQAVDYDLAEADENLGSALSINLPAGSDRVRVEYQTSPDASGVQWLTPAQTAGKQHPFLFTQAQAVHARSFIPLQDSPKVRVTYTATIRTPQELLAVMSASNDPDTERDGVYEFNMPQPIPSYLIALAVGDLEFKPMGERTGVYAEPSLLEASAKEFEDTESMLIETEKRYGKYSWDRYDLLILPPSFPFGGMENPRLSFITPTVISGDKSLVALIAHELAHSWSGNTITNATWRDLWLNEGFTTYLTYRIMEFVYGEEREKMEFVLGLEDLQLDVESLPPKDQRLAIDLRGRNPDDVFSNIPYEKGALFLRELEQNVGRDNFDQFLLGYFNDFAFQSITTDQFLTYLEAELVAKHSAVLSLPRIKQWIFEPGVPEGAPTAGSGAFAVVDHARNNWLRGEVKAKDIDTSKWVFHQWKYFLSNLPEKLTQEQLAELDDAFGLTKSTNNEIASTWLLISINNWYEPAFGRLHEYLVQIGRNKLVRPLYAALSKTPEGKVIGRKAFEEAKPGYHPLTVVANQKYVE